MSKDPTTSTKAMDAKMIEVGLMTTADLIASTGQQPTDLRAWEHLLIYCPRELLEKRLREIEHRERMADRERRIEAGGRLWLEN